MSFSFSFVRPTSPLYEPHPLTPTEQSLADDERDDELDLPALQTLSITDDQPSTSAAALPHQEIPFSELVRPLQLFLTKTRAS